jgi:hypothetical protein
LHHPRMWSSWGRIHPNAQSPKAWWHASLHRLEMVCDVVFPQCTLHKQMKM